MADINFSHMDSLSARDWGTLMFLYNGNCTVMGSYCSPNPRRFDGGVDSLGKDRFVAIFEMVEPG